MILIDFFDINRTSCNQFHRDDLIRFQEFESRMLIKLLFESDFIRNLTQSRLDRMSFIQFIIRKVQHVNKSPGFTLVVGLEVAFYLLKYFC